jgi:hypothetical protein
MRDVSSEEESRIVYPLVTGSNPVRLARLRFQPAALQQTATSRVVRDSHSEEFGLPPARIACAMRDGFDDGRRVFDNTRRSQKFSVRPTNTSICHIINIRFARNRITHANQTGFFCRTHCQRVRLSSPLWCAFLNIESAYAAMRKAMNIDVN